MVHSIALVTGATSGLGYAAALALAADGWQEIIITGCRLARVQDTATQLAAEAGKQVFTPLELDLNESSSTQSAVAELIKRRTPINFLLLNAGLVGGNKRAPLIDHNQLAVGLLNANLLSAKGRIVISGAEPVRGDMPLFSFTEVAALAAQHHQGDRSAAIQALLQSGPGVKYAAHRAYADAKLIIVWWVAALARHLPSGMAVYAVYAVSPGSVPDTQASRNAGLVIKWVMLPVLKLIPGMSQTPETAARRYLQAYEFGTDVSGLFYASPPKKVTGPVEAMQHPRLHDCDNQEAAWKAVVEVSVVNIRSAE